MRICRLALLAALALLFSCNKEEKTGREAAGEEQVRTFVCTLSDELTKVAVSDAGKARWEVGDQILVHGAGASNRTVVTLSASDISADGLHATIRFSGIKPYDRSSDKGYISTLYAAYPAEAVLDGNLYYYARFGETNHPLMAAYDDTKGHFIFYNLCGLITFRVSGDYDSYEFAGNAGETVGYSRFQSYLVLKKDGTPRLDYNYTSDNGTSGPLTTIEGPVVSDGQTLNRICIPCGADLEKGFTITLKKSGKAVAVAKSSAPADLPRSGLLALGDISTRVKETSSPGDDPVDDEQARLARLGQTPIVAVYFTEYTPSSEFPTLEDVRCFTHINVGHARFVNKETGDGGLEIKSPGGDYMKRLAAYKSSYPELKLLLFIGGWGKNANGFSAMAKDPAKRQLFCSECVRICDEYNLDGVDIDWEYPTYAAEGNGADPSDTENFTTLVKELRAALGTKRLISYAASDNGEYINHKEVLEWVDYINVMTYSMGDPPYHNSPLYRSSLTRKRSGAESIEIFHSKGVPYDRMNYGMAFYGHADGTVYPHSMQYYRIVEALETGKVDGKSVAGYNIRWWDDVGKNVYLGDADGKMYASYEDEESLSYRVAFVKSKGMLGAFAWEYREDAKDGTLRKALWQMMHTTE